MALRLGIFLMCLTWALVVVAYNAPGDASVRYWMFVCAHVLNFSGFMVAALADASLGTKFSTTRLVVMLLTAFLLAVLGPVFMSAAAASLPSRGG